MVSCRKLFSLHFKRLHFKSVSYFEILANTVFLLFRRNLLEIAQLFTFFFAEPPSFVRKLENLSSLSGSEVSLICSLKGSEPITVAWLKDNHELKEAENIQITYENKTALLQITNLQSSHCGKYSCQVQNQAGSQTCSAVLTVKGWLRY